MLVWLLFSLAPWLPGASARDVATPGDKTFMHDDECLADPDKCDTFVSDDECLADPDSEACALNALQRRKASLEIPKHNEQDVAFEGPEEPIGADVAVLDLPSGMNKEQDFPETSPIKSMKDGDDSTADADVVAEGVTGYSWCSSHSYAKNCYLYTACQGRSYCVIGGYMIVPGRALAGMESIHGGNAHSLDYLFTAARNRCGDTHCVLITNPIHHRTQDQLHIHYRHYNGGGAALKGALERTLCHKGDGWHYFSKCGPAKARKFNYLPGVFSTVAGAYGGANLANVGITVWFTDACGQGRQTLVLATTHCSIEHAISAR